MALSDPQKINPGSGSVDLPRTSSNGSSSIYTSADDLLKLTVSTQQGKRKRQVARVDSTKITENPFIPTQNQEVSMSCYIVFDRPLSGFSNDDALKLFEGLVGQLTASTSKVAKQVLGGES